MLHSLGLSAAAAALLGPLQEPSPHVSRETVLLAHLLIIDIHLLSQRLDRAAGGRCRVFWSSTAALQSLSMSRMVIYLIRCNRLSGAAVQRAGCSQHASGC